MSKISGNIVRTLVSPSGIEGLDELAAELGGCQVSSPLIGGIVLERRSGKYYDLIALLAAHLRKMRRG